MRDFGWGLLVFTFLFFFVLGIVSVILPEKLSYEEVADAVEVCEANGGVMYIELDIYDGRHDVRCNDGVWFFNYNWEEE